MSAKKEVLEVRANTKKRVHRLAKKGGSTVKDTSEAILSWALPHFEDGRCILTPPTIKVKEIS